MDLHARIADVHFFGYGQSRFGFIVESDGFDGWEDGGTTRSGQESIPGAHGDYDLPQFLDSRIILFSGICKAPSPQALANYGRRMKALLAWGVRSARLVVTFQGVTQSAEVRLAPGTTPKFKSDGGQADDGSYFARFSIQFKAPDPRKFVRPDREFILPPATPVQVFHRGNFWSPPRVVVTGVGTNDYSINHQDGRQFRVSRDLVSPQPHTIDLANGHLLVGGAEVIGGVRRADSWSIENDRTTTITFDPNGNSATAVLYLPDADI